MKIIKTNRQNRNVKWIDVKKRLPQKSKNGFSKRVLVYSKGEEYIWFNQYDYNLKDWTNKTYEISHWMLLPKPPKQRANILEIEEGEK